MGETFVHLNGRIATEVTRRDLGNGLENASFLFISTERRFDKQTGEWADGRRLSLWVTCWRRLARNVADSLNKGDEVMVHGRLRTREYEEDGKTRYATEVDAFAVGPNLNRAIARVQRIRAESDEFAPAPDAVANAA